MAAAHRDPALRLGVDLGGTKIEAVVLRLEKEAPAILSRRRVPTEKDQGYDHILRAVSDLLRDVTRDAGLSDSPPIGVGMPGSVTVAPGGGAPVVKNSNTTCLNGRPFRDDLMRALGRPVAFANDANCFALAEARYGAARGRAVVFGVILGTGVGGGVVLHGRSWDGAQGIAGEWGHNVLDPKGPPCYCGRRGCVEQYLSGPAIEAAYAVRAGVRRTLREIGARPDDEHAQATLSAVCEAFGRALAMVINILDPEAVVLGGGVSNLPLFYREGTAAVARFVFNDRLATPILPNMLGDSAGVLGAALLP